MNVSGSPRSSFFGTIGDTPVVKVSVNSLTVSDSPRLSGENIGHVYALVESAASLPPIVVHRPTMRVLDGVHRLRAARLRGEDEIDARFFDGDEDSAFVFAVQANIAHGLPLSLTDRKAAAARITKAYPHWSDRAIASVTGLSHGTVAVIRQRSAGQNNLSEIRIGRDGRARPRNNADGRDLANKLLAAHPDASLREIARQAQISPSTARSLRTRLSRSGGVNSVDRGGGRGPAGKTVAAKSREQASDGAGGPFLDGGSAWQALCADPAFRSTDSGRSLLRMLSAYQTIEQQSQQLIDQVPVHCISRVAVAAQACAQAWQHFAEHAERQSRAISED